MISVLWKKTCTAKQKKKGPTKKTGLKEKKGQT